METFTLAGGLTVPQVGFGTYKAAPEENSRVLDLAIAAGYRYFDTASFYGTETALGDAVRRSALPRADFFLASKLWKDEMGYAGALAAFERTKARLQTDYLDLYLIHWPRPDLSCDWQALVQDTWRALEELHLDGQVRAIGVSNFLPHHLDALTARAKTCPMVDQLEFHPGYTQQDAVDFCAQYGILPQAWSPLGRTRMLGDPLLVSLAAKYGVTTAQLCLRFCVQKGVMPLPKSSSPERMAQNLDIFGFALSQDDLARLDAMPQAGWSGEHPDRVRVPV